MSSKQLWAVAQVATGAAGQLSASVPSGEEHDLDWVSAHNTSGAAVDVTFYLVPPAGTAGTTNQIYKENIAAGGTSYADGLRGHTLVAGASVWALASASGVNCACTGRKRTI